MTSDDAIQSDLELAIAAGQAGAGVLQARYGGELEHHHKSPTDFATEADVEAEQAILDVIRFARPGDAFIGEELGSTGSAGSDRLWLVDPLCGTLNFAATTALFSVNVALQVAGTTQVAVVVDPMAGELYWADGDAFGIEGRDRDIAPSSGLVDVNVDGPLDREFLGPQLIADPRFRSQFGPRVSSTTLALAWVATGQRVAYVTDGDQRGSVHFAAGIKLCEAAGCVVTDLRGQPVHTGPGVLAAADPQTHAILLDLIAPHLDD